MGQTPRIGFGSNVPYIKINGSQPSLSDLHINTPKQSHAHNTQWTYRDNEQTFSNASSQATHRYTQHKSKLSLFSPSISLSVCMHFI